MKIKNHSKRFYKTEEALLFKKQRSSERYKFIRLIINLNNKKNER